MNDKIWAVTLIVVLVLITAAGAVWGNYLYDDIHEDDKKISSAAVSKKTDVFDKLKTQLAEFDKPGRDFGYYIKDLTTGKTAEYNSNEPMCAASLIKLYIMGTAFDAVSRGEIERDGRIDDLVSAMISASANEQANELVKVLGKGSLEIGKALVNEYSAGNGYKSTVQYNDLQGIRTDDITKFNSTSPLDCGLILERIYEKELHGTDLSDYALKCMENLDPLNLNKIPAGLDGVRVANKTGENSRAENDAAIVFAEGRPYILVVMYNGEGGSEFDGDDAKKAIEDIVRISNIVHEYMEVL